jgi:kinesin family protein 15
VKCSYLEIYNEQILDLLNPSSKQPLSIREDVRKGVYVENLIEEQAVSYSSIVSILQRGGASRHIGGTLMNTESSRSHAIFILNIESRVVR